MHRDFTLGLPKRNSFIVGFASALLVLAAIYLWQHSGTIGGVHADSPNGDYELSVTAPLSPRSGGKYNIRLVDKKTSVVLRQISIAVPADEQTIGLRGSGSVVWDPTNTFVDVQLSGQPLVRVWVP